MTTSSTYTPFGGRGVDAADAATAKVAVIPVPYDLTSTWKKGADRGPAALLEASANMELYDIETAGEVHRKGIATLDPIVCGEGPEHLADLVDDVTTRVLERSQLPVVLGGEHSVSIGAIRAAARRYQDLSVLQIDAHADTRETYQGSRFNHACVMARAREYCASPRHVTQVGIRAIDAEEVVGLVSDRVFYAHQIVGAGSSDWVERVVAALTKRVYVTIDLDGFDPSVVPATGTPEPGGLGWYDVNALLHALCVSRQVVGFDVVELLPTPGQWASELLAAKLVYRFLSEIFASPYQSST